MREIKFRAWSEETSHYYDVESLKADGSIVARYTANGKVNYLALPAEEIEIEQYTGLKDKNGKEIYEGDILGGIWEYGYIAYCDKCKQLQLFVMDLGCMRCQGDVTWSDIVEDDGKLEVIGDIHTKPKLREEQE